MNDPYKPPARDVAPEANPQSLSLLWNPIHWIVLITALLVFESAWLTYAGEELPENTWRLWALLFGVFLAWWVHTDRRSRQIGVPFEFDAAVVFFWPIVLPYYLYRSRGRWGLLLGASSWLLFALPTLVAWAMYFALPE